MTLDIARFGKYTVRPVRLHPRANAGDRYDIEGCSRDEAEYFAVYRDQPPPLDPVMWVADFDTEEDAITFASLTEKLLAIREGTKATADSLEKILAGATAMKKERDALVEMLPHLCDDCRLGIPTVIRQKFTPPRYDEETLKELENLTEYSAEDDTWDPRDPHVDP